MRHHARLATSRSRAVAQYRPPPPVATTRPPDAATDVRHEADDADADSTSSSGRRRPQTATLLSFNVCYRSCMRCCVYICAEESLEPGCLLCRLLLLAAAQSERARPAYEGERVRCCTCPVPFYLQCYRKQATLPSPSTESQHTHRLVALDYCRHSLSRRPSNLLRLG